MTQEILWFCDEGDCTSMLGNEYAHGGTVWMELTFNDEEGDDYVEYYCSMACLLKRAAMGVLHEEKHYPETHPIDQLLKEAEQELTGEDDQEANHA